MHIWIDADACPKPIREILFRAAERVQIGLTLVANQAITVPRSRWIQTIRVAPGFDVADQHIAERDNFSITHSAHIQIVARFC